MAAAVSPSTSSAALTPMPTATPMDRFDGVSSAEKAAGTPEAEAEAEAEADAMTEDVPAPVEAAPAPAEGKVAMEEAAWAEVTGADAAVFLLAAVLEPGLLGARSLDLQAICISGASTTRKSAEDGAPCDGMVCVLGTESLPWHVAATKVLLVTALVHICTTVATDFKAVVV